MTMLRPQRFGAALRRLAGVVGSGVVAACAAADPAGGAAADCRVAVKLVSVSTDIEAVERQVGAIAGVAARHAASIGPAWHALVLRGDDAAQCDAAIDRLRAAATVFEAVERDRRRRAAPA